MTTAGVVGIGDMGSGLAKNLIAGGFETFGYDPDPSLLSPANAAVGVPITTNLTVTFNETVQAGSGLIQLWRADDDSLVESFDVTLPGEVAISGAQVTVNPSADLEGGSSYYVTIDSGGFEDLLSNPFGGLSLRTEWGFITESERLIRVVNTGSKVVASALGSSSTSLSFDAGGNATMLVVAVSTERSTETTYTVRYDGHDLAPAIEEVQAGIWYLDLGSTSYNGGAANIVVDFSGVTTVNGVAIGAVSVEANAYAIELHSTATGAESASLVTSADETLHVASFNANGSGSPSISPPLTTIYTSGNIGTAQGAAGYQTSAMAGSHECAWNTSDKRKVVAAAFVVANSFDNLMIDHQLGVESGMDDDPDGDRLPNALEAWFGTDPLEFSSGIANLSTNGTVITFSHPVSDRLPDDLVGSFQWSMNLSDWYDCDGLDGPLTGQRVTAGSQTQAEISTVTLTASQAMGCLFLRPVVTASP